MPVLLVVFSGVEMMSMDVVMEDKSRGSLLEIFPILNMHIDAMKTSGK